MKKILAILLTLSCLLIGCQTENKLNNHLNVGMFWISTSLDPTNDYDGWVLSRMGVGETLMRLNEELEVEPWLVSNYTQIDEYTWQLIIKDNLYFSNKKLVDAKSVANCIQRVFDRNLRATEYFDLKDIQASGQTLTISLNTPSGAILNNLCEPLFTIYDTSESNIENQPICTGPFVIETFVPERSVECKANDNYWQGEVGLESVKFTQIADSDARVLALQSGEVDMVTTIDYSNLNLFKDTNKYTLSEILGPRCNVVYLNNESEFLSNKTLRQALSYVVDRQSIVEMTGGKEAIGLYSTALPYGNGLEHRYRYDLDKANQLLDQAEFIDTNNDGIREKEGKNIVLNYYESADHGSSDSSIIAQSIQSEAKKVGISIQIIQTENMADVKTNGTFDLCSANDSTAPTGDPEVFLTSYYKSRSISNISRYSNTLVDQSIEELTSSFNKEIRHQLAFEASSIILEDAANIYVSYLPLNTITSSKVKQATQHPVDYYMMNYKITVQDE